MPRAEEYQANAQASSEGLPYGAVSQADAAAAVAPDQSPAAQPIQSPVNTPTMEAEQPWKPPAPEQEIPNIDPENGWNYDEVLMGGTQRPGEPVTTGVPGTPGPKVSELLQGLSSVVQSPDIQALQETAMNLGM